MKAVQIFKEGSKEYLALSCAAWLLTTFSPNGYQYYVGETYFDFGADLKWTTILCHKPGEREFWDVQALSPLRQTEIISANTFHDIMSVVNKYFSGEYCVDKK